MAVYNAPVKEGTSMTLGYTGVVDTLNILKNGLYKFELHGASGALNWTSNGLGPRGGLTVGYKLLNRGDKLYPCIGGQGCVVSKSRNAGGGYNGGGNGSCWSQNNGSTLQGSANGGGGATHIATISGTLQQIGAARIATILAVAGGAGAGPSASTNLGAGGGLNGGNGSGGRDTVTGGSQSSAGKCDWPYSNQAAFGKGGMSFLYNDNEITYGGGGGLYGGGSVIRGQGGGSDAYAGGGSGYIGGVPAIVVEGKNYAPSTAMGAAYAGNGRIIITLVKILTPTIYWGDQEVDALYYGDQDIDALYYGDQDVA